MDGFILTTLYIFTLFWTRNTSEKVEEGDEEGEKMELSEDTPTTHTVEEENSQQEEMKDSQPLAPKEGDGVREDQANKPPPLMGPTSDHPHPLMEARPAEPHPLAPPTLENKPRPLMEAVPIQPRPLMETNFPVAVEKPRPLMSTKPPQVTSDYHSASDTPREDDKPVAMATANHTGPVAHDNDKTSPTDATEGAKEVWSTHYQKSFSKFQHDLSLVLPNFRRQMFNIEAVRNVFLFIAYSYIIYVHVHVTMKLT